MRNKRNIYLSFYTTHPEGEYKLRELEQGTDERI
jgi:hypothetical protein